MPRTARAFPAASARSRPAHPSALMSKKSLDGAEACNRIGKAQLIDSSRFEHPWAVVAKRSWAEGITASPREGAYRRGGLGAELQDVRCSTQAAGSKPIGRHLLIRARVQSAENTVRPSRACCSQLH